MFICILSRPRSLPVGVEIGMLDRTMLRLKCLPSSFEANIEVNRGIARFYCKYREYINIAKYVAKVAIE